MKCTLLAKLAILGALSLGLGLGLVVRAHAQGGAYCYITQVKTSVLSNGVQIQVKADGYIEPRNCGIGLLRICFTELLDPATVSTDVIAAVGVTNGDCSAQVADVTVDDSCMWVEFSPVLPDQDTYEITVSTDVCDVAANPLGGDRDRVLTGLKGDINSDMVVRRSPPWSNRDRPALRTGGSAWSPRSTTSLTPARPSG